jgi:hypothetical protein
MPTGFLPALAPQAVRRAAGLVARLAALASVLAASVIAPAIAGSGAGDTPRAEERITPFSGVVEACDATFVLNELVARLAARERDFGYSSLEITGFEGITQTGFRSNGLSYIPRRYCRAEAMFNDGVRRRLVYNIGEHTGFIGQSFGLTWCVVGLDREHAFGADCKAAGP